MKQIREEKLREINCRLFKVEHSLTGLGSLFRTSSEYECLNEGDMTGIGELILMVKNELAKVMDELSEETGEKAEVANDEI